MRDDPTESGWDTAVEASEAEATTRRERCGTERRPGDPILCRVCGEPVLDDGWAP